MTPMPPMHLRQVKFSEKGNRQLTPLFLQYYLRVLVSLQCAASLFRRVRAVGLQRPILASSVTHNVNTADCEGVTAA